MWGRSQDLIHHGDCNGLRYQQMKLLKGGKLEVFQGVHDSTGIFWPTQVEFPKARKADHRMGIQICGCPGPEVHPKPARLECGKSANECEPFTRANRESFNLNLGKKIPRWLIFDLGSWAPDNVTAL